MANMSYCRFRNTLSDLRDCINAIDNREHISLDEESALTDMICLMFTFLSGNCLIDGEGEFDHNELEELVNEMRESED